MRSTPRRTLTLVALILLLALPRPVSADAPADDLRARRARLMERLGPDAMFIAWSAPPSVYSRDIDYEYRQDSNLLYLTGIEQEDTILVLMPGNRERKYEVEAAIEAVYLSNGAMRPGYPSIVGSGPNATVLHYNKSNRQMLPGDLLLVDAAASYQGLTGDITRTYPVNGTFSPAQKDLYALVLAAQDAGMQVAKAGNKAADIQRAAEEVVKKGLLQLGLVTDASGNQFRAWWTHGIVHWIGLDVHDVGDPALPLAPGMTFVIEPGLYIREAALDNLPNTPENLAFIEMVRPAVQKYKDIGVRIEDSFLLTESGLMRLSARVPRTIEEIEQFMRERP